MKFAVLITCHNRKLTTLSCLEHLFSQSLPRNYSFEVFLVDDGCSDGTAEAVVVSFPRVFIVKGSGSLFWNQGMRLAWETAVKFSKFDGYIWLNDDTMLDNTAFRALFSHVESLQRSNESDFILVGSCKDPVSGSIAYGGKGPKGELLFAKESLLKCHTMNGNFVFIPNSVYNKVGTLSGDYLHSYGDSDYALRARQVGIPVFVLPGFLAVCRWHDEGKWSDPRCSLKERWYHFHAPNGLYPKDYWSYIRKHMGFCSAGFRLLKAYFRMVFGIKRNFVPKSR